MSGVTAAVIGGVAAVGGAYIASKGAKDAAKTGAAAGDRQLQYLERSENKARGDINRLMPEALVARLQGLQQQADYYSGAAPAMMDVFQQGNMNAQNQLAGSMPQIQNALMGNAVDYGFMQPKQIEYDMSNILGGMPQIYDPTPAPQVGTPQNPYRGVDFLKGLANGSMSQQQYLQNGGGTGFQNNFGGTAVVGQRSIR